MLNMDYSHRVVIDINQQSWVPSPKAGVLRKPLAREEAERGHATSIVQYQVGASFSAHDHPLGEEILVLEGTFSDETGDFKAGTYFRNPPGFHHAPFSETGCIILVKLHQFQPDDGERVCINTLSTEWQKDSGVDQLHLHQFGSENVSLLHFGVASHFDFDTTGGEEVFVVSGALRSEDEEYPAGTWIRNPPGYCWSVTALPDTRVWRKSGHLAPA